MPCNLTRIVRVIFFMVGTILTLDCLVLILLLKINVGTIIPFFIGIIFLVHAIFWQTVQKVIAKKQWLKCGFYGLWGLFCLWLVSFVLFVLSLQQQINAEVNPSKIDALIVLGAGVNGDQPTPTLASRLDKAHDILTHQPQALTIVSGGIGIGRKVSEAQIMANYLHNTYNVPLKHIQREQKSTSTQTNLAFSKPILKVNGLDENSSIAIVTSDFHTIRAKAIAHKQGYNNVTMVASATPLSIRFNAWFREYFAFVSGWLLNEY